MPNQQPLFTAEFQGYAEGGKYQSGEIRSIVPEMEKENARQMAAYDRYIAMEDQNNQRRIKAAQQSGNDLKALASMSKTLSGMFFQMEERARKEAEIDATLTNIFGEEGTQEYLGEVVKETEGEQELDADLATISADGRAQVEQEHGLPMAWAFTQTGAGSYGPQYASGKQQLAYIQTAYAPWMSNWSQSNTRIRLPGGFDGTVAQAYASGDPRLIAAATRLGRRQFFMEHPIHDATRGDVARYLGTTIFQTEGALNAGAGKAAAEDARASTLSQITAQGYTTATTADISTLDRQFADLSLSLYTSGAAKTRSEANELALNTIVQGLIDTGNVDGLRALLGVQKIPGQAGTQLGGQYGHIIRPAILKAQQTANALDRAETQQITSDLYEQLSNPNLTSQQRVTLIQQSAERMRQAGLHEEARNLELNATKIMVPGGADLTATQLSNGISTGEITTPEQITQVLGEGRITQQQADELLGQLSGESDFLTPKNPLGKDLAKEHSQMLSDTVLQSLGLKRDPSGAIIPSGIGKPVLTSGEGKVLVGQIEREINAETNRFIRNNPHLRGQALNEGLTAHLQAWRQRNIDSPTGKFYIPAELLTSQGKNSKELGQLRTDLGTRMKGLLNRPRQFTTPGAVNADPVDFSSSWDPSTGLPQTSAKEFNPVRMDTLFTPTAVQYYADQYNQDGSFDPNLVKVASMVGMSPLDLLKHQHFAYRLSGNLKPPTISAPAAGGVSSSNQKLDLYSGTQYLMSMGVPARGAAFLSGNIMQESGWNPNRTPWDDGGADAGGLASWRGGRLANAENAFGQVEQATTQQQLTYLMEEMRTRYPQAHRIFMNPHATDKQLRRASVMFWGYGEEGRRYDYAQDVLNRNPDAPAPAKVAPGRVPTTVYGKSGYQGSNDVISVGQTDYKGRQVMFAPNAAKSWKAMVAAGMPVNPKDIANGYRNEAEYLRLKQAGYNPAECSAHNHGEAIDAHGALGAWIRKNGARYGWFPVDYQGTHGGHFEWRPV